MYTSRLTQVHGTQATALAAILKQRFSKGLLIWIICLGFLTLTVHYSFRIPLWEAPDEPMHVAVVRDVAAGRLPPQMSKNVGIGEDHQPPLYYLMAAPAVGLADGTWLPGLALPFPRGAVAAAYAARLTSALLAVGTILCVYYLAVALLGSRRLAATVAAFTALTPGFVMTSATANNDNAAILFSSATALFCVKAIKGGPHVNKLFCLAALAAVAAVLSKLTGLFAVVLLGSTVLVAAFRGHQSNRARALVPSVIVAGLLLAVAFGLSGQVGSGQRIVGIIAGHSALSPQNWGQLQGSITPERVTSFLWDLATSYWGAAGWQTYAPLGAGIYWAVAVITLLALSGAVAGFVRRDGWQQKSDEAKLAAGVIALATASLLAILAMSALGQGPTLAGRTHARFLFPAIGATSLFLMSGFLMLVPSKWRTTAGLALVGGLALLHAGATFSGPNQYSGPIGGAPVWSQQLSGSQLPVRFASGVNLVAFNVTPDVIRPSMPVTVTLLWQADTPQQRDMAAFVHLVDWEGKAVAKHDGVPTIHRFPPRLWRPGDYIIEQRNMTIPDGIPPGGYRLQFGAYYRSMMSAASPAPVDPLLLRSANGQTEQSRIDLGQIVIRPDEVMLPDDANRLSVQFAEGIVLTGIHQGERAASDPRLTITLYWSANSRLQRDYAVSVQVLGRDGALIAQDDAPLGGALPSTLWAPGETITGSHSITIPGGTAQAGAIVGVAIYDPASGQRLAVREGAAESRDNLVFLLPVQAK